MVVDVFQNPLGGFESDDYDEYEENVNNYIKRQEALNDLEVKAKSDRILLNQQLCYRLTEILKQMDLEEYEKLAFDNCQRLTIASANFVYQGLAKYIEEKDERLYFQIVKASLKDKELITYALQSTKGIGSLYIEATEFVYVSFWVSVYKIDNPHLQIETLKEQEYSRAIGEHWVYEERKHRNYFFYLNY
ncbi:UNKNOWN [Stylonychia lemnae]|uniref:Uncharacterized protein n=1 Tax=Stylonychia lemnae TaxID=5949 RepID=A0A078AP38_STYLE|nr:UNKNOWN [Stylonychia lemnae]|eukprot:CDW83696.1 UNKNOWN [Stylonychia lemnae]